MRLQEITANKLSMVRQLKAEIKHAEEHKLPLHAENCKKELEQTKYEAMHPEVILNWLNKMGILVPAQGISS